MKPGRAKSARAVAATVEVIPIADRSARTNQIAAGLCRPEVRLHLPYSKSIRQRVDRCEATDVREHFVARAIHGAQSHTRLSVARSPGALRRGNRGEFLRGTPGQAWLSNHLGPPDP